MLCKISVLKNFLKFTGKHLCQSHIFNKVAGWRQNIKREIVDMLTFFYCAGYNKMQTFSTIYVARPHSQKKSPVIVSILPISYSQPAFTWSKLTIETLKQEVKHVKVNNKNTRTTPVLKACILLCKIQNQTRQGCLLKVVKVDGFSSSVYSWSRFFLMLKIWPSWNTTYFTYSLSYITAKGKLCYFPFLAF